MAKAVAVAKAGGSESGGGEQQQVQCKRIGEEELLLAVIEM
jgi:hypothetical protein